MSVRAKRYWGAVQKDVYEDNLQTRSGKVYYSFTGQELMISDEVGDVVRSVVEAGLDSEWMVFKYVPVPSSMHAACWAALHGESEDVTFQVRIHEKFAFPQVDRGADLVDSGARPSEALRAGGNTPLEEAGETLSAVAEAGESLLAGGAAAGLRELADEVRHDNPHSSLRLADAQDYDAIARLLEDGDLEAAQRSVANLDTTVREEIPRDAWPYLGLRPIGE